jgi:Kef-type K+ transport system membrane component KefB
VIETDSLVPLGLDFLTFLAATVLVIPLFKSVKASPILGFLFSGLLLGQLGQVLLCCRWHAILDTDGCALAALQYIRPTTGCND